MPMLSVRCAKCKTVIPTGVDMSYDTFRNATLTTHNIRCPSCGHQQRWTIDDVDRSVFPEAKK
jgi:RNase P subunit RPR2